MTNETIIAKVLGIETKEGTGKNDKKWKRYGIKLEPSDGSSNMTVGTFDADDQKVIKAMVDENVKLEYKTDGDFKNLVKGSIKSAREEDLIEASMDKEKSFSKDTNDGYISDNAKAQIFGNAQNCASRMVASKIGNDTEGSWDDKYEKAFWTLTHKIYKRSIMERKNIDNI